MKNRFTSVEDRVIANEILSIEDTATILNRSVKSIYNRRYILKKSGKVRGLIVPLSSK